MPTYQFPLNNQDEYPGRIVFEVRKETQPNLSSTQKKGEGNLFTNILSSKLDPVRVTVGESCSMYLPNGITVQDGVVFDNEDLGVKGAATLAGAASGSATVGSIAGRALNPIGDITAVVDAVRTSHGGDVAREVSAQLASKVGGRTGAIATSALLTTANPNSRAVFKTVSLREFSFSFKMMPTSQAEAEEIVKIIRFFRLELYPESFEVNGIPTSYKFPNKFAIRMYYGSKRIATEILPSYLRNISTTYNSTSQSFYKDGNFSEIDVTLTFAESRTLSKKDIQNGTDERGEAIRNKFAQFGFRGGL